MSVPLELFFVLLRLFGFTFGFVVIDTGGTQETFEKLLKNEQFI